MIELTNGMEILLKTSQPIYALNKSTNQYFFYTQNDQILIKLSKIQSKNIFFIKQIFISYRANIQFLPSKYPFLTEQISISYRANIHFISSKNPFLIEHLIRTHCNIVDLTYVDLTKCDRDRL